MNCMTFNQNLDDYLSDELTEQDQFAFLGHAADCSGCERKLEAMRYVKTDLSDMFVPPVSSDFADRVLRQAKNGSDERHVDHDASHHRGRGFVMGFGSALAAGMVLWGVVALFPSLQEASQQPAAIEHTVAALGGIESLADIKSTAGVENTENVMADVTITLDQTSQVNLVFDAVAALENAKISIDLPSNIILAGYPELRRVEWRTNLAKGSNLLRLPIIATKLGREQTLVAHIEYGEQKVTTLKIKLAVVKQDLSQRPLLNAAPA